MCPGNLLEVDLQMVARNVLERPEIHFTLNVKSPTAQKKRTHLSRYFKVWSAAMGITHLLLQGDGMSFLPRTGAETMPAATQPHSPMTPRHQMKRSLSGSILACVSPSCFVCSTMGERPPKKPDPSRTLHPALPSGLGALPWLRSRPTFSRIPDWAVPPCMHVTASQLNKVVHVSCMQTPNQVIYMIAGLSLHSGVLGWPMVRKLSI